MEKIIETIYEKYRDEEIPKDVPEFLDYAYGQLSKIMPDIEEEQIEALNSVIDECTESMQKYAFIEGFKAGMQLFLELEHNEMNNREAKPKHIAPAGNTGKQCRRAVMLEGTAEQIFTAVKQIKESGAKLYTIEMQ